MALFFVFADHFNVWLNYRKLDFYIRLSIQYCDILFRLKYMKKIWSHKDMDGSRRNILRAFSQPCEYFSLILHQNSTSNSFLKVS